MRVALLYPNTQKIANQAVGYIACAVLQAGHTVDILDTAYMTKDQAISKVVSGGYDIILISACTVTYQQTQYLAAGIKAASDTPIILGGIHATVVKGDVLRECPSIDYICVGEGEEFIVEFLGCLLSSNIKNVRNLGYRDNGKVILNPVRPCLSLNAGPSLDYAVFQPDSVVQQVPLPGFCYVYATRGCPFNCSYCCNSCYFELYGKDYLRTRSVDTVIKELKHLKKSYPIQFFYFGDEMILFNLDYCTELFTRVYKEIQLPYGCLARVERITPKVVSLLKETGCRYVGMGVECADEEFRRTWLNRKMTNTQIVTAFGALRSIPGIYLTAFYMTNWPVTYDDRLTKATTKLITSLKPDYAQRNIFYPFPGTKLYKYCLQHNLIDQEKARRVENVSTVSVLKPVTCGEYPE